MDIRSRLDLGARRAHCEQPGWFKLFIVNYSFAHSLAHSFLSPFEDVSLVSGTLLHHVFVIMVIVTLKCGFINGFT